MEWNQLLVLLYSISYLGQTKHLRWKEEGEEFNNRLNSLCTMIILTSVAVHLSVFIIILNPMFHRTHIRQQLYTCTRMLRERWLDASKHRKGDLCWGNVAWWSDYHTMGSDGYGDTTAMHIVVRVFVCLCVCVCVLIPTMACLFNLCLTKPTM